MSPGVVLLHDSGRVRGATAHATRLLERAASPDEVTATLRALAARAVGPDDHAVVGLPMTGGGRLVFVGARAGREVTVVVDAEHRSDRAATLGRFTDREREVLELIVQGLSTKRIAALLHISPWTVTDHLSAIFAKAGVTNRSELMALALTRAA